MNAIHIIMATSSSANPHNSRNQHIESIVKKRKISAITFLVFGILLIIAGSLLASFESQRFSSSFIIFGVIALLFAVIYWVSAEKILTALKYNLNPIRLSQTQNSEINLPSYEQSVLPHIEIPPPYEEAIKIKSDNNSSQNPIRSISLSIDQRANSTSI